MMVMCIYSVMQNWTNSVMLMYIKNDPLLLPNSVMMI
jgi:hypothetical protein